MLASLNETGRAAIVLDTGAASRGSGNANRDKEKAVRQWFVERDFVEAVVLLPENLFYNTPAAGIIMFLNLDKPQARAGSVMMVNASASFAKGKPKNYLSPDAMDKIAGTITGWTEVDGFSRSVDAA